MSAEERRARLAGAVADFCRWLTQERELRALARDDVARLTKLGPAVIDALESGDPERMPPQGYVLGYLRSYAGVVGLDADDVVLRWQEVVGPEEMRQGSGRRRFPVRTALGTAAAIAVAGLLALALFGAPRQRGLLKLERPRAVERAPYAADHR
jgi:hypothetical protein